MFFSSEFMHRRFVHAAAQEKIREEEKMNIKIIATAIFKIIATTVS